METGRGPSLEPQYLTKKHVARVLGIHPSTVMRWVRSNGLPHPIELGPNRTVWLRTEIDAWREDKERNARRLVRESRTPRPGPSNGSLWTHRQS
ncbi:MAG: hypothetical protein CMM53_08360 [Rhodospirillaceae bacterium]|nr:hypothetical protein [Rhodospirillaceae bacterium]